MAQAIHGDVSVGTTAPEFSGSDEQGHRHRLSEYAGSTLVLCFLPHPESIPSGRDLSGSFPGARKKDVFILGVMTGTPQTVGRVRAHNRIPFPIVCDDGRIAATYGLDRGNGARFAIFVIDPAGVLKGLYKNLDNPRHLSELLSRA